MKDIAIAFGQRVRVLRQSKKISQEKLAELSGLHTTYIGQIERGEKSPTLDSMHKIALGLDISLCELFKNTDDGMQTENFAYASEIYNKIIGLDNVKKEKIYRIFCDILEL